MHSNPLDDPARLEALHAADLLDSAPEEAFDRFTSLAAAALHVPVALLSLVDADRQFFKSCIGLSEPWASARQTPLSHSFYQHAVVSRDLLVIEDARQDPRLKENAAVQDLAVVAYVGVPLITSGGHALGLFCVIDSQPRRWSDHEVGIVRDLAAAVMTEVELRAQTRIARREARDRQLAERRLRVEQAVSVTLGGESSDLQDASRRLLDAVGEAYGCDWSALWVVDRDARVLRCAETRVVAGFAAGSFDPVSRSTTLVAGAGLPGRVWQTRKPAWIEDVQSDANFPRRAAALEAGLHGAFCFPILWDGEVVVVTEFLTREAHPPDEPLLSMLEATSRQVAQFTRRKHAEDEIRRSEARYAAVVQTALDCIVGMDHQGRVTEWNPAAEQTFGYSRDQAVGQEMASLIIPPALRDRHRAGLSRYLATGEGPVLGRRFEIAAVRKDGSEFPVELTIIRLPGEGPPSFTGYVRDIAEWKSAEAEREQLLDRERAARVEAERASRMKDEFLATLSHELRTPLHAILGWSHVLAHGSRDEGDLIRGLRTIERNARAQTQIIEDLLDMSRIVSGKVRLDVQRVDLGELVRLAVETAKPSAEAKGIRLQAVLDPHAGPISGDPNRLQQVFWNLLSNAVKFTPKGGRVQVLLQRLDSELEVSVIDTGEGIRPEFLPHVFDRFRQSDSTTTRTHGGLGIGLSIVKQLVELHGGSVRVKSLGTGQGATFVVALPLTVVHPEPEPAAERRHPRASPSSEALPGGCEEIEGVKVLVVDDEPDARALIKRLLEDYGAEVITAASAADALDRIRAERPHVLISDVGMPGEDGYSLIRRVRALGPDHGGNVPAVALTAYARSEDRTRSILAGFQMHIAKPVEALELIAIVATLAGRTH